MRACQINGGLFVEGVAGGDQHRFAHPVKRQHAPALAELPRTVPRQIHVQFVTVQRNIGQTRPVGQKFERLVQRHDLLFRQDLDERFLRLGRGRVQVRRRPAQCQNPPPRSALLSTKILCIGARPSSTSSCGRRLAAGLLGQGGRPCFWRRRLDLHRGRLVQVVGLAFNLRHGLPSRRGLRDGAAGWFQIPGWRRKAGPVAHKPGRCVWKSG